jgi:hypothetical protein
MVVNMPSFGSGFLGDLEVNALATLNANGLLEITVKILVGRLRG